MLATFKILEPYSESYLSNIIDRHLFVKILLLMQAKLAPKHGPHRCTAELMSPVMDLCNPSQRRLHQTAQSIKSKQFKPNFWRTPPFQHNSREFIRLLSFDYVALSWLKVFRAQRPPAGQQPGKPNRDGRQLGCCLEILQRFLLMPQFVCLVMASAQRGVEFEDGWLGGWMAGRTTRATWQRGAKGHPAHPRTRASQNMTWHEPFRLFFLFPFYSCPSVRWPNKFFSVFRCDPWVKYYVTQRQRRRKLCSRLKRNERAAKNVFKCNFHKQISRLCICNKPHTTQAIH